MSEASTQMTIVAAAVVIAADIPHMPSGFVEFVPLSGIRRQGNCRPYAAIRWHDFGSARAWKATLVIFLAIRHTCLGFLLAVDSLEPTPERVFVADHQSSSVIFRNRSLGTASSANWNVT